MNCCHTTTTLVLSCVLGPAAFADLPSEDSTNDIMEAWVAAFNQNEPDELLAFYDRSEEIEVVTSSGLRHRGFKAVRKAYADDQQQLRMYDSTAKEMSTRILGETAIVSFEHQFKLRFLEDDSRWQVRIRTTSVLHRIESEWKIVLEHSSAIRGVERITQIDE